MFLIFMINMFSMLYANISELPNIQLTTDLQNRAIKLMDFLSISITEFEAASIINKNVFIAFQVTKKFLCLINYFSY